MEGMETVIGAALILTIRLGIPVALLFVMGYSAERFGGEGANKEGAKTSASPLIWPAPPTLASCGPG